MASRKKIVGGTVAALAAGYVIGILTAPRSGKKSRKNIKRVASSSVADVERQLKDLYKQSQELIDKFSKDNPKLTTKLEQVKERASVSQGKIKNLLSAIHGNDSVDEDLSKAVTEAREAYLHLKDYVSKK
jgi:gas vesicle protein